MRKFHITITMLAGLFIAASSSYAAKPIDDDAMGLSKTSVFATPTPKAYHEKAGMPGTNKVLPRSYPGAPPQVSHGVKDFLPITAQSNMCLACHNQPSLWGQQRSAGMATPIPPSHYTDRRNAPDVVGETVVGARYNCNQCHVPQTNAPALVKNAFPNGHKR